MADIQNKRFSIETMWNHTEGDVIGVNITKNTRPSCCLHTHDCFEIEIISSGGIYEIVNSTTYQAKRGSAFILTPNDLHELRSFTDQDPDVSLYTIMFHDDMIDEGLLKVLLMRDLNVNYVCELTEDETRYIETVIEMAIKEYWKREKFSEIILKNTVSTVASLILRKCSADVLPPTHDDAIRKAMLYLQMHFKENPSLSTVAEQVNLTPAYFSVLFHKVVGVKFKRYINELKLNCAKQGLMMTNFPITDICFSSGFESLPQFYKEFKKEFGKTPNEFRREYHL